ncbi:Vacuolar import and degradation protein 27 [Polyrhizophydium stewartii]|uniref:Vacuolar import and degradation protein 27 n=1 Tax=Polyrhizophydium stewartii TaxID=2732419 RepID=A0ABR4N9T8_9FUNG|nr:hypothetical protein HK105_004666 [Polyrhizophydium stewartii]
MFLLKSLGNIVFGSAEGNLIELPSGQLFYLDPSSTKASRTLVFRDAKATVRRTGSKFNYQLVVTRVFEEGEAELETELADNEDELPDDEQVFLIGGVMLFHMQPAAKGHKFVWADVSDETGTCGWEFVPDAAAVNAVTCKLFEEVVYSCMFEQSRMQAKSDVPEAEFTAYVDRVQRLAAESNIGSWRPNAVPQTPAKKTLLAQAHLQTPAADSPKPMSIASTPGGPAAALAAEADETDAAGPHAGLPPMPAVVAPEGERLADAGAELYIYDMQSAQFVQVAPAVQAALVRTGPFDFVLTVVVGGVPYIVQPVASDMSPVFSVEHLSFVWVWISPETGLPTYSWSIKFDASQLDDLRSFMAAFTRCISETKRREEYAKVDDNDRMFIEHAYQDVEMEDRRDDDEDAEDQIDEDDDIEVEPASRAGFEPTEGTAESGSKNSLLAVGYSSDRSFVVRGNRIGVFGYSGDNELQFSTTINNVSTLGGDTFSPRKVMLHKQDSSMLLMHPGDKHTIYRMDLDRGKVVDEWQVGEEMTVDEVLPSQKYAQRTGEETFLGINDRNVFRLDPRLSSRAKRVESESSSYATKYNFTTAATTGKGNVAIASRNGDIRLYNKIGIRAKTLMPGLGDKIIGLDTTEDGKFLLATCQTYLLLIETEAGETSGFTKSLGDKKPMPKRLQLRPEHAAWMGERISFTPARFNTGDSLERTIVTSTGSYIITWNFRQVKNGKLNDYSVKKYADKVVADNFKYGADRSIIVTLPENVEMVSKRALQTPTKMLKSRSDIVNSPY